MTTDKRIKSLVIVGGGTAGWMAAASLQRHFSGTPLKITLVESPDIGTIGVGEATTPTFRRFCHRLGLQDLDVMRAIGATCKLGIQFNHWKNQNHSFFHPFSVFGQSLNQVDFLHYWLRARKAGLDAQLTDFSLGAGLALAGKFSPPSPNPPSTLSVYDWALHLDAGRFAALLREKAVAGGVEHVRATVHRVTRAENGFVHSLLLDDGRELAGDLFIDCSGFRGLLIEDALQTGFEDWSHWLLCDGAWVAPSARETAAKPYTQVNAHSAGWQWHIPLQERSGNGRVFSSRYIDAEQVRDEFSRSLGESALDEPRLIRFKPGIRRRAWNKNVIALGLSAGFIEPLESTSIALIETGIERLKTLFPQRDCHPDIATEFNEQTRLEYERVRDFVLLHYALNGREDSDFWRECRAMAKNGNLPESLQRKINVFLSSGYLLRYRWEMFQPASWLAIFAGFDRLPHSWNLAADALDQTQLLQGLRGMRDSVRQAVREAPAHQEFIARYVQKK
ncbi:tryptophan halogenase family protein [Microbulbifer thermotolerans]|uniref:tryptophan halogenase family protein n=1 Tax=Microbulbifer thermotolerans TaxID=252514 RepID=UPI00224A5E93|nr:tryptophan halogenase family protein [Microbulbifer thermotolerans]MCX2836058.1 tryptophan 7-halogenase [Microbulbifer thermotolerans]